MTIPIRIVDAFAASPFAGNPAAVCTLEAAPDETWCQNVAAEMNLSETAFVWPEDDRFRLRWFTPSVEVPLCGHATLAAAHVLWETQLVDAAHPVAFDTLSGVLSARAAAGWIELDFPSLEPKPAALPAAARRALGDAPVREVCSVDGGFEAVLALLDDARAVRSLVPDLGSLRAPGTPGLLVTAPGDTPGCDFVSRFFAPGVGIDEDPVTGGAHCALAPFWSARTGRSELVGHQLSARGGVVRVKVTGTRVRLQGQAVTVVQGTLSGPAEAGSGTRA